MKHMDQEQLILYRYGEPITAKGGQSGVDERSVEAHLASCASCRAEMAALDYAFGAVDSLGVPERPESYGQEVWRRLRPRLEEAATPRRRWGWVFAAPPWMRTVTAAGAVAALVVAAFLAGRFWPRHTPPERSTISAEARDRILLLAVADHMERSSMLLKTLENSTEPGTRGEVDISWERERAEDLVAGNRIYQQTALQEGEPGLANLLDDLGRVLLAVAHSPSDLSPAELEELRQRIESQGILFKMQVVNSQLQERVRSGGPRQNHTTVQD